MSVPEALWQRVRAALALAGHRLDTRETPALLGRRLAASGEGRVARFVRDYYYPRVFGLMDGVLDDAGAEQLVQSMESGASDPVGIAPARTASCPLCGREESQ